MTKRASIEVALGVIALAFLMFAPSLVGPYWLGVLLQMLSLIALTQSWVAFSGLSGYVSLAHAVFYGLGAYIMAILWQELPIWQILPLAGVAAVILAVVIGYPALRVRGPYFVILTLGLSEFVKYIVVAIEAATDSNGRLLLGTPDPEVLYYLLLGLAVTATLFTLWLSRSRWGVGLRAIREDETAAATLGVPVALLKTGAFALSAFIPGIVGAVWVMRNDVLRADRAFQPGAVVLDRHHRDRRRQRSGARADPRRRLYRHTIGVAVGARAAALSRPARLVADFLRSVHPARDLWTDQRPPIR